MVRTAKLAEVLSCKSKFFLSYPFKTAKLANNNGSHRGYFDMLEQSVAFGFNRTTTCGLAGFRL